MTSAKSLASPRTRLALAWRVSAQTAPADCKETRGSTKGARSDSSRRGLPMS